MHPWHDIDLAPYSLEQFAEFYAVSKARQGDSKAVLETFRHKHTQTAIERAAEEYRKRSMAA